MDVLDNSMGGAIIFQLKKLGNHWTQGLQLLAAVSVASNNWSPLPSFQDHQFGKDWE